MVIIIQDYGTSVTKKSNCLCIKSAKGESEICINKVKELHICSACKITSDAISLCIKNDVWVVFMDDRGEPEGEILPFSGGCSPIYKRKQLLLQTRTEGIILIKGFLTEKITNRLRQLKQILRNKSNSDTVLYMSTCIKKMEQELKKIDEVQGNNMEEIRDTLQGYEGTAGRAYFECISYLLPEEMKFSRRTRMAEDVYNGVLNYLYGILYAKIKQICQKCRLDPYIGIMHVDSYNKPTFVFDFIETQRIICEEIAFEICSERMITRADTEHGESVRFLPAAKQLLISKFYEKLNQPCTYRRKKVTIERRIYLQMGEAAKRIEEVGGDVLAAV